MILRIIHHQATIVAFDCSNEPEAMVAVMDGVKHPTPSPPKESAAYSSPARMGCGVLFVD
jgi:hypothetical protein